jgi:hypothetical protein
MATTVKTGRRVTLLDLLSELQAEGPHSEEALLALVLKLVRSGRVVLCGNYARTIGTRSVLD